MTWIDRQQRRDGAFKQLALGCEHHPAYRYKKKPTGKCERCLFLFDLAQEMKLWEREYERWKAANMAADREAMARESRRLEQYHSSHQ